MDPLARPEDRELFDQFRSFCQLTSAGGLRQQVGELARAFATIPYENLTKIVKDAECGSPSNARRTPHEVFADHQRWNTGGTCFSLTATLLKLVRSLGVEAEPILADRRYGADTHCAMILWLDAHPHLLDPGYLIVDPVPLAADSNEMVVPTRFNEIQLVSSEPDRLELHTLQQGERRHRLTFKMSPVDESQFQRAWEASFDWDMMHYPLLTKVAGGEQLYMRGGHLQRRSPTEVCREEIPDQLLAARMVREFGIHPDVVHKALQVLRRRGD